MGHLIRKAQLVHGRCGIAAADDGGGIRLGKRLGHSHGSLGQDGIFEHAHGAVPHHGLCALHCVRIQLRGLGADVQAFLFCGDLIGIHHSGIDLRIDGIREAVRHHCVDGQKQLLSKLFGLFHHLLAVADLLIVH